MYVEGFTTEDTIMSAVTPPDRKSEESLCTLMAVGGAGLAREPVGRPAERRERVEEIEIEKEGMKTCPTVAANGMRRRV